METPKEYYYTYYSYEEWGRGYFGSRGCKCLPEEDVKYFGSFKDKTFNPTQKIILKSDYTTREEALTDEIILQEYYKVVENPHFANRAYQTSTKFYYILPFEEASKRSKELALKQKENKTGIFSQTPEQRRELGIKVGLKHKENSTGIFSQTLEERRELGRRSGLKCKERGTGVCGIPPEEQSIRMTKTNLQKWECIETGFVTNAGNLTQYQRRRGIDTSKRRRIS